MDRIGTILGNYQLTQLLGQGGFAEVYLARHLHLKTQVAIKILYGKLSTQDIQAFTKEAQTIASLQHPHILRVFDFGFMQSLPFLVMDYAPGGTLRDRHPEGSQLPLVIIVRYLQQLASALIYAHKRNLIHRDVKPENMLVDNNGALMLGDFGIVTTAHSTTSMKTIDKSGTVHYMAPEQIQGHPHLASDQYSLAIVIYEWLCGQRPFTGNNPIEIAMKQLTQEPPELRTLNSAVPAEIEEVILRALRKDPKQRFPDILAFAHAFEQASQSYQGTSTRPVTPQGPQTATPSPLPTQPVLFSPSAQQPGNNAHQEILASYDEAIRNAHYGVSKERLIREKLNYIKSVAHSPQEILTAYDDAIRNMHYDTSKEQLIREKLNYIKSVAHSPQEILAAYDDAIRNMHYDTSKEQLTREKLQWLTSLRKKEK